MCVFSFFPAAQESLLSAAEHMSDEEDNVHRAMLKKLDCKYRKIAYISMYIRYNYFIL